MAGSSVPNMITMGGRPYSPQAWDKMETTFPRRTWGTRTLTVSRSNRDKPPVTWRTRFASRWLV